MDYGRRGKDAEKSDPDSDLNIHSTVYSRGKQADYTDSQYTGWKRDGGADRKQGRERPDVNTRLGSERESSTLWRRSRESQDLEKKKSVLCCGKNFQNKVSTVDEISQILMLSYANQLRAASFNWKWNQFSHLSADNKHISLLLSAHGRLLRIKNESVDIQTPVGLTDKVCCDRRSATV